MGFSLSIGAISTFMRPPELHEMERWMKPYLNFINESFDFSDLTDQFPFHPYTFIPKGTTMSVSYMCQTEVGWSWWDDLVKGMYTSLGEEGTRASAHMYAFWSVAVPFDVEDCLLGKPKSMVRKVSLKSRVKNLVRGADPLAEELVQAVEELSGGYENLRIGSLPRILAEIEAACRIWNLPEDESEARERAELLYKSWPEDSDTIAVCYALICRSFMRYAMEHKHLVWFIK